MWPVFARIAQAEKEILKSRPLNYYFPFVGGNFPYNGFDAPDITISSNTVWDDFIGFKQVGKLTINAGVTLKIERSPFIIFADEIVFGGTNSIIDGNGPSGAASGEHPNWCARGGTAIEGSSRAQGGCGGIMLLIVTNKVSGAKGVIRANGGDGWTSSIAGSYVKRSQAGQGALSDLNYSITSEYDEQEWGMFAHILSAGGGSSNHRATGGGTGRVTRASSGTYYATAGGGSGVGGGGGTLDGSMGQAFDKNANLFHWLTLFNVQCLGGGGGGAAACGSTSRFRAGGGGGGMVGVLVKDLLTTPLLEANGGKGKAYDSEVNGGVDEPENYGGAGATFIENVSLWGVGL